MHHSLLVGYDVVNARINEFSQGQLFLLQSSSHKVNKCKCIEKDPFDPYIGFDLIFKSAPFCMKTSPLAKSTILNPFLVSKSKSKFDTSM